MEREQPRSSPLATLVLVLLICGVLIAAAAWFVSAETIISLVDLPSGHVLWVDGDFTASSKPHLTIVQAGGHTFEFTATSILADGTTVASLDASVESAGIETSWRRTELLLNEKTVWQPPK